MMHSPESPEHEAHDRCLHRHPAHYAPIRRHNRPVIVLVTVCVCPRRDILSERSLQDAMIEAWRDSSKWRVGEYTIMPDHVHWFCSPGDPDGYPLRRWVGYWKRLAGKIEPRLKTVFQEDCWDTQMRDREHYEEKISYVRMNPFRRDLVTDWRHWPFRGKIHNVAWM